MEASLHFKIDNDTQTDPFDGGEKPTLAKLLTHSVCIISVRSQILTIYVRVTVIDCFPLSVAA